MRHLGRDGGQLPGVRGGRAPHLRLAARHGAAAGVQRTGGDRHHRCSPLGPSWSPWTRAVNVWDIYGGMGTSLLSLGLDSRFRVFSTVTDYLNRGHVDMFYIQSGLHRGTYPHGVNPTHKHLVCGLATGSLNQQTVMADNAGIVKFKSGKLLSKLGLKAEVNCVRLNLCCERLIGEVVQLRRRPLLGPSSG